MSGSVVTPITNILPQSGDIIRLQDRVHRDHDAPCEIGTLHAVTAQGEQHLAHIRDIMIEVPADQAAKLQQLVGRRICLAIVDCKFRVGAIA
jgi:hypothetical protein